MPIWNPNCRSVVLPTFVAPKKAPTVGEEAVRRRRRFRARRSVVAAATLESCRALNTGDVEFSHLELAIHRLLNGVGDRVRALAAIETLLE